MKKVDLIIWLTIAIVSILSIVAIIEVHRS